MELRQPTINMVSPAGNGAPGASGNDPALGYILKLIWKFVLFMFSCVLIMNTMFCYHVFAHIHHEFCVEL
jgi:hypothetical protein